MIKDHLGIEYKSVKEMCEHYKVKVSTYYYRIKVGYSLEQALTITGKEIAEVAKTKFINCQNPVAEAERVDHLGNVYISKTHMCDHYGVSRSLYDYRRRLGWTLEKALCEPIKRKQLSVNKRTIDGVVYKTVSEIRNKIFDNFSGELISTK